MRKIILLIVSLLLCSCAQVTNHIYADGEAEVTINCNVDKQSAVDALRGAKTALY